ncbi:MAG: polyribonucleotide nucleotidyltransferase [Candidatus Saelkia tenebricola]|nr:polyribonucleotide nucleotidyltransferase [Candidatus Saelkia tenebricola]
MKEEVKLKFGAEEISIKTGQVARQANGSVLVQYGETIVLVSAVMGNTFKEDLDFLPLTVEYKERTYAAGKIPGGFFKREGRPSEKEILTSRLIDRPIRPLFPKGLRNEIQIISIVLSSDGAYNPDVLAVIGASAALHISEIPFEGPIAAVRVAHVDQEFVINPTYEEVEKSKLNLVVVGTKEGVVMLEGEAKEVSEDLFYQAVDVGYQALLPAIELQSQFREKCGKEKKDLLLLKLPEGAYETIKKMVSPKLQEICLLPNKEERMESINLLTCELEEEFAGTYTASDIKESLSRIQKNIVRNYAVNNGKRIDGREFEEVRPISCEVGFLPRTHGSALFTRGQTQSLAVTTLGTTNDEQMIESLEGEMFKKFMLHYNFPPFSVGETRPMRGPGRREIGHGALAEKALKAVMPEEEEFPYTVRLVSDVLESNGSSSMATICGGSLSMMDAGVPLKSAVAGIALGLFKEQDKDVILTDIAGLEDHYGDMDFKVAGTKEGVTAIQMDIKINGIKLELIDKILKQAQKARLHILNIMDSVLDKNRSHVSSYAPRITSFQIPHDKIGLVIGPGGKTIKRIISETGAKFDIDDNGIINIAADNDEQLQGAILKVKELIQDPEVGKIYAGKIVKVVNFGAFCEILPGKEGLIHVSEISNKRVPSVEEVLKVGEEVQVKVLGIDDAGKIKLSMKQVQGPEVLEEKKTT